MTENTIIDLFARQNIKAENVTIIPYDTMSAITLDITYPNESTPLHVAFGLPNDIAGLSEDAPEYEKECAARDMETICRCSMLVQLPGRESYNLAKRNIILAMAPYGSKTGAPEKGGICLNDIPYMKFLDMNIICKYMLTMPDEDNNSSALGVTITGQMLHNWGITSNELFCDAEENTRRIVPPVSLSMEDAVSDLTQDSASTPVPSAPMEMTIVTNRYKTYGAISLYLDSELAKIADNYDDDLIILPSSTHEIIAIKASEVPKSARSSINEWVASVNDGCVEDKDLLSYNAYIYSHTTKSLSII